MKINKIKSNAKLNLALNITGKKKVLHKIESIIGFIDLHDVISINQHNGKKHHISFYGKFSKNIGKKNTVQRLFQILDKENFIGSSVTKWTKVTLNFRITTPSWYFNAMKYIGVVKGANKDNVETNATTANTHTGDSDNGNSIVIPTDRYFNFFNEEVAEKDSSVTVGLGGMIFSGFVVGGFAAYGGLATYAIFVLIGRRMRNNDDGLGF